MRRTIIVALVALVIGAALGVYAQVTVDLFPSTQVSAEVRANAVWGVCKVGGYGFDESGEPIPGAWTDDTAMWQFYRAELIEYLKVKYRRAKWLEEMESVTPEQDHDIGSIE